MKQLSPWTACISMALAALCAGSVSAGEVDTKLVGYNEVPSVSSAATGRFKAKIDEKAGSIEYELSYSGLEGDARMAHIHFAQRGTNGGIMVWLCQTATNVDPTGSSPTCLASGTVTGVIHASNVVGPAAQGIEALAFAELVAAIKAGAAYVNVHSSKFPAGELRGQLRQHH